MVTPFAAWAVARVGGLERGSLATQLMTGTPYVAAASLIPVLLAALTRNRVATGVALVTTAALGFSVLPRAFGSAEAASGTPLRVLTLNAFFGRADPEAVMELVRRLKPDVLSTQELTPGLVEKLDAAGLGELMPHRLLAAEWSARGSGLYAKYPLTPLENLFQPIGHNMPAALINLPGVKPVEFVDVHPYPPLGDQVREWTAALEAFPRRCPEGSASSPVTTTPASTMPRCAASSAGDTWTRPSGPVRDSRPPGPPTNAFRRSSPSTTWWWTSG